MTYVRKSIYSIESVLEHVKFGKKKTRGSEPDVCRLYEGDSMNMTSLRYQVFALKGVTCVRCGVVGKFFAKEKFEDSKPNVYHFNLYAVNELGQEVLMTKDHILPRSRGGSDELSNLQPMCCVCNFEKGNSLEK